jgi:uncharacterized protein with von Willebrand factor type A (vWA) domain
VRLTHTHTHTTALSIVWIALMCVCVQVYLSALKLLRAQLRQGSSQRACGCPLAYLALHDLVDPLAQWLASTAKLLEHSDMDSGSDHIWGGGEVLALFADTLQLSPSSLGMFCEHLQQVVAAEEEHERQALQDQREGGGGQAARINVQYEEEEGGNEGEEEREEEGGAVGGSSASGMKKKGALATFSLQLLKDLFRIFEYMLKNDAQDIECYKLVVLKQRRGRDWDVTLNLWWVGWSAEVSLKD